MRTRKNRVRKRKSPKLGDPFEKHLVEESNCLKKMLISTLLAMTLRLTIWLFLAMIPALRIDGQDLSALTSAPLIDTKDSPLNLSFPEEKPVVILILGSDCPITQKYVPTIESLKTSFDGVAGFIGIFPNQYSAAEVATFVEEYQISFPCYIDRDGQVIELIQARVTPEAFLLSADRTLLYGGAIDNWFYKLGSYRTKVTSHYLREAMRSHLAGDEIKTVRTEAIGCPVPQKGQRANPSGSHSHH